MKRGRFQGKSKVVYIGTAILVAALNAAAWNSTAFSDWYIAYIFPVWVNTYGRVTGLFPFSVGEWLLVAGVVVILLAAALAVLWGCAGIVKGIGILTRGKKGSGGRRTPGENPGSAPEKVMERASEKVSEKVSGKALEKASERVSGKAPEKALEKASGKAPEKVLEKAPGKASEKVSEKASGKALEKVPEEILEKAPEKALEARRNYIIFRRFSRGFGVFFVWTLLAVCLIMTLNCFVLYHASTFSEQYFGEDSQEHALVELIEVYNMVAEQCNRLSHVIGRDENGMAVYTGGLGDGGEQLDMEDMARKLMRELGREYPQLEGYYPRPKALRSSDFMCQQHMQGYYFPFSMEANYNHVMHILNFPATMCHELAHLRGYIYEDEANFISYLACTKSENAFFQYSGYLSVLVYLNNDLYRAWKEEPLVYEEAVAVVRPVAVEEQVWEDNIFVTQEEWDRINENAWLDTDFVDRVADKFIDVNLKVNGVADGKVSYSRVVKLLLQYYFSNLSESPWESRP